MSDAERTIAAIDLGTNTALQLAHRWNDARARGQLAKRLALVALLPLLGWLLLHAVTRNRWLWRADRALVASLFAAGLLFVTARGAELATRAL